MTSGNRFFPGKLNCRESEKRHSLHLIPQDDDILRSDKKKNHIVVSLGAIPVMPQSSG